jgi:DNA invertase Pin-like site-specific DNA recombinase
VSTEDQALGPEAQKASIEAWAARCGASVVAWHLDQGVSGAAPVEDRPGLLAAIRDLQDFKAGLLVVAKWDRVARSVMVAAMVETMAERCGARIESADGVGNGDGPEAGLMRDMVKAFAAYERALIRSRTKAALRILRAKGKRAGEVPFGFRLLQDGKSLAPDPEEQEALALARDLRERKASFQRIADALTAAGFKPRGRKWYPMTILRMLDPQEARKTEA